jgi:hypothetical protein
MFKSIPILLCLAALMTQVLWAADPPVNPDDDAITIQVVGTLHTGLVVIGGETTGTEVRSKGRTWELEFPQNTKLKQSADTLNGKRVSVEGSLEYREGVELKGRWIITVTRLQAKWK